MHQFAILHALCRPDKDSVLCPCKVHVEEWRTALWREALSVQGIDDAGLAADLQHKFRTARLEHFQLEPGVKASRRPFVALVPVSA